MRPSRLALSWPRPGGASGFGDEGGAHGRCRTLQPGRQGGGVTGGADCGAGAPVAAPLQLGEHRVQHPRRGCGSAAGESGADAGDRNSRAFGMALQLGGDYLGRRVHAAGEPLGIGRGGAEQPQCTVLGEGVGGAFHLGVAGRQQAAQSVEIDGAVGSRPRPEDRLEALGRGCDGVQQGVLHRVAQGAPGQRIENHPAGQRVPLRPVA